jgi:hypothetical protein
MDELELLEYARTSVWSAEKALRLTLEPGIGWSLVDDLVLAQTAITEKIEDLTRARRATKPTITPTGEWLRGQRTTRPGK